MSQPISLYVTCKEKDWGTVQVHAYDVGEPTPASVDIVRAYATTPEGNFAVAANAVAVIGIVKDGITYVIGTDLAGAKTLRGALVKRFGKLPVSITFQCDFQAPEAKVEAKVASETKPESKPEPLPPQKRVRKGY
jgi:hypothetical protein